jgi:hypothetical protein
VAKRVIGLTGQAIHIVGLPMGDGIQKLSTHWNNKPWPGLTCSIVTSRNRIMAKPRQNTLKQDFAIFGDAGFLITLVLILALLAVGTGILIWASEKYGIPVSPYWE